MENGVKLVLEVDTLAEAVGADQDLLRVLRQGKDAVFAFLGRQQAGDGGNLDILDGLANFPGNVLGRVDKPAEDDRTVAIGDHLLDEPDGFVQLGVFLAHEFFRFTGKATKPVARATALFAGWVGAGGQVENLGNLKFVLVEDGPSADLLDFLLGFGLEGGGTVAERGGSRGGTGGHRPQQGQGGPPADPSVAAGPRLVGHHFAGEGEHLVEEGFVFGA